MSVTVTQTRARHVGFVTVLTWSMAIGMLAQLALGALAPFILADLGISRTQFGVLSTVYFAVGSGGSLIAGPLVDQLGGRRMTVALFVIGGLGLAGLGMGASLLAMGIAAGFAGVATAVSNPVTNQLISVHLPRGQQGFTTGIKQSGVGVAALLSGIIYPPLGLTVGWRAALVLSGLVALGGAVAALAILPKSERQQAAGRKGIAREQFRSPTVRWLAAYALMMGAAGSVTMAFLVLYGVESLELSESVAGASSAVMGGVGLVARIMWGRITERSSHPVRLLQVLALLAAVAQVLIWAAVSVGVWGLWVGVMLYGATAMGWNSVAMLMLVRRIGPRASGTASGIVQATFYTGYVFAPLLFGWSVDATEAYNLGWALVTLIYLGSFVLMLAWTRCSTSASEG